MPSWGSDGQREMAGYSGTPLQRKLGLKPGMTSAVIDPPGSYAALLGLAEEVPALDAASDLPRRLDYLHVFTTERAMLERLLTAARSALEPAGMVWVSWPKKASRRPSEITEDTIRALALPLGFVDVKVCAVDEVWSSLKLVIRKDLR